METLTEDKLLKAINHANGLLAKYGYSIFSFANYRTPNEIKIDFEYDNEIYTLIYDIKLEKFTLYFSENGFTIDNNIKIIY